MTKDDIIRMAREAGLAVILGEHASEYGNGMFENTPYPELERFANLVAAAEREAIAKLADASVNADQYPTLTMLAQAIRMRGD